DAVRSGNVPSALDHYLAQGRKEGRRPSGRYDGEAFRGAALEWMRHDAVREAQIELNTLKLQLKGSMETRALWLRQEHRQSLGSRATVSDLARVERQAGALQSELARARDEAAHLREALDASTSVRDAGERALLAR